jgi:hypothetical protein
MKMSQAKCKIAGYVGTHQRDIIYDTEGISPCINGISCEGGYNNQPRIIEYEDEQDK